MTRAVRNLFFGSAWLIRSASTLRRALAQSQANDHARAAMETQAMHPQAMRSRQMQSQAAMPGGMNGADEALERQHQAQTQSMMQRHSMEQDTLRQTQQSRPQTEGRPQESRPQAGREAGHR